MTAAPPATVRSTQIQFDVWLEQLQRIDVLVLAHNTAKKLWPKDHPMVVKAKSLLDRARAEYSSVLKSIP